MPIRLDKNQNPKIFQFEAVFFEYLDENNKNKLTLAELSEEVDNDFP